jgi:molybdenum cofactor biosynthesis enzyme
MITLKEIKESEVKLNSLLDTAKKKEYEYKASHAAYSTHLTVYNDMIKQYNKQV